MRRPWRLVLEVGNPDSPPAVTAGPVADVQRPEPVVETKAPDLDVVWPLLVDARTKLVDAMKAEDEATVNRINQWIGGALSATGLLTETPAEVLRDRLAAEVPAPEPTNPYAHMGEFKSVERERPQPHPGAQRPIDPHSLSAEERAELGIVLPGEDSPDE